MESYASLSLLSKRIISEPYRDPNHLELLSAHFTENHYVKLPYLFTDMTQSILADEIERISVKKCERNFQMTGYDTPRQMSVISGHEILTSSMLLVIFYAHYEIRKIVSTIVGQDVFGVDHKNEFMVVNLLEKNGDTHGWHLDDPRFALIVVLHAPPEEEGGNLEYVKDWRKLCQRNNLDPESGVEQGVELAKQHGLYRTMHHSPGDSYLINAAECLHRVAPLTRHKSLRCVLNMAYDDRPVIPFGITADLLYGEQT